MSVWTSAFVLFLVGTVEFFLSEYQTLVSVRLKVGKTVAFAYVNHVIDFLVHVFLFSMLFAFWRELEKGVFDIKTLIPYLFYIHGCIAGTGLSVIVYKYHKKVEDRKRNLAQLERARHKKKILKTIEADLSVEVEEDIDEEMKQEEQTNAEETTTEVHDQIDDQGSGPAQEEPTGSPAQSSGPGPQGNSEEAPKGTGTSGV